MLVKTVSIVATSLVLLVASAAQTLTSDDNEKETQRRVQKLMFLSQMEGRIREVGLAAPRVLVRYRIAGWLWNEEKDDAGRAEELAVAALEDLYKNRAEIPTVYFSILSNDMFALLDRHAPRTAKTLRDKYNVAVSEDEGILEQLVSQAGSEKAAVDVAIRSLSAGPSTDFQIPFLLHRLKQRKSVEVFRLLDALIVSVERAPGRLQLYTLIGISPYFADLDAQRGSAERFARIVVRRAKIASQLPFADFDGWLDVLTLNSAMISQRTPDLVSDAEVLRVVLTSRISRRSRVERERNERINNSIDKLGALIEEAEQAQDPVEKYDFFRRAARLALEKDLFRRSTDLAVEFGKVDLRIAPMLSETQALEFGQFLEGVTARALKAGDEPSALYALGFHKDNDRKAEGYISVVNFFVEKGDLNSGRDMFRDALRVIATVEDPARRATLYFKLIPAIRRIDPTSVFDVNVLAARSINAIPSLNPEDKPETENFKKYVAGIMVVNWNLLPMLVSYVKTDKNGASDLSGRIEKREVKVFAEFVLGIAALDDLKQSEQTAKPQTNELRR
ncbi:MAG: hypothetical protein IPN69_06370 [Acidobacteria bacterium]|nr:hypothetical protein [Acidobacteriota bacterium]